MNLAALKSSAYFQMGEVTTIYSFDTEYSACSVEAKGDLIATGTYQVVKVDEQQCEKKEDEESPETKRLGRVYLHRVKRDEDGELTVDKVCSKECKAVLDMKWSPGSNQRLGVADAGGQLNLYKVESEGEGRDCELLLDETCTTTSGLALSLDWSASGEQVVVSDSKGKVVVVRLGEAEIEEERRLAGHSYEAWTAAFSRTDPNIIFSGGDDCVFNMWDLRVEDLKPIKRNSKEHNMGVTTVLGDSRREEIVFTGSYDENVRCWDYRNFKCPVWTVAVGGGVWRIKQKGSKLLVGAMHNGFEVLEVDSVKSRCTILAQYSEHESLAYGADWVECFSESESGESDFGDWHTAASCSFYDHTMKMWRVRC